MYFNLTKISYFYKTGYVYKINLSIYFSKKANKIKKQRYQF